MAIMIKHFGCNALYGLNSILKLLEIYCLQNSECRKLFNCCIVFQLWLTIVYTTVTHTSVFSLYYLVGSVIIKSVQFHCLLTISGHDLVM